MVGIAGSKVEEIRLDGRENVMWIYKRKLGFAVAMLVTYGCSL